MGWFEEVDLIEGEVEWGEFMRIRVSLDVTKPLVHKKQMNIKMPDLIWLSFTYERLPFFVSFVVGSATAIRTAHYGCRRNDLMA